MQLKNSIIKQTYKPMFLYCVPLFVYYSKCEIFIRRSSTKFYHHSIQSSIWIVYQVKLRSSWFIKQIRIEYIEFISLDSFWGRVILVIVSLVVFVPLKSCFHNVIVSRLSQSVLLTDHTRGFINLSQLVIKIGWCWVFQRQVYKLLLVLVKSRLFKLVVQSHSCLRCVNIVFIHSN